MSWHYLCELAEIPENSSREFVIDSRIVALFHSSQGLHAIDGMCAHQGGPIAQGQLDGKCVTCPWHGWQYDITNGKNLLTGKQMLDCFAVERRGDAVWVNITPLQPSPT